MTSRDGFVEFVEGASGSLRGMAYLICGDWHRADDAVQDALHKLYLAWPRVNRADNVFAYARRTVVNAAIDSRRRAWHRERLTAEPPDQPLGDTSGAHAERDLVMRALAKLPRRQRACVVLRYYEDLSVEQTAAVMGCSTGNVKSQTSRALTNLRPLLDTAIETRSR